MVTIKNELLEVCIAEIGAQLMSIRSAETGIEYLWQRDPAYWDQTAPNLFPFVGRLYNKQYRCHGKTYPMVIHGFLPQSVLTPVDVTESTVTFELHESEQTLAIWPFRFTLRVHYVLEGDQLHVTYEVRNDSAETLYYGCGGHPGFNVPLEEGLAFTDYQIEFPAACDLHLVEFDNDLLVAEGRDPYELRDNRILPLSHELFGFDALVFENVPHEVTLRSDKGCHGVTLTFPQMNYLGLWHMPRTDAPYLCIEPWSVLPGRGGIVEDLETMPGMTPVAPGETGVNHWSIRIY